MNNLSDILTKYKDQKPMDLKTAVERSYPISAVINMMEEYLPPKIHIDTLCSLCRKYKTLSNKVNPTPKEIEKLKEVMELINHRRVEFI